MSTDKQQQAGCGSELSVTTLDALLSQERVFEFLVLLREMATVNGGKIAVPKIAYFSDAYSFAMFLFTVCRAHDIQDTLDKVPLDVLAHYGIDHSSLNEIIGFINSTKVVAPGYRHHLKVRELDALSYACRLGSFFQNEGYLYNIRKLFSI